MWIDLFKHANKNVANQQIFMLQYDWFEINMHQYSWKSEANELAFGLNIKYMPMIVGL